LDGYSRKAGLVTIVVAGFLAYLWGGLPTAYLLVRLVRGTDIRRMGTGNAGAANVVATLGKGPGVALGVFDAAIKGTLPVVVVGLLGQGLGTQMAVGAAAVAGHNWSPFLRLTGGRGVASALGVYAGLLPVLWPQMVMLAIVPGLWGWYVRRSLALWIGVGMAAVPAMSYALGQPPEATIGGAAILAVLLVKRLTANWERPPAGGQPLRSVLFHRLVHDRDIPSHDDWVRRGSRGAGSPSD